MAIDPIHAFASIRELGRRLRARQFTSVDLTRLFLDRLEKHGKALGADGHDHGRHRPAARLNKPTRSSRLGAIVARCMAFRTAPKDLLATVGAPTTWGAPRSPISDLTKMPRWLHACVKLEPCLSRNWRWSSSPEVWATNNRRRARPAPA